LAELAANATEMTIDAVLALHLLHELHVQGEKSHWWPYVSALPKDVGSPLLWAPKELAQLEGSNLVGFRDAVLSGWMAERETLFPKLTNAFPETFPEQHFRAANWAWAMSIVWSRAAHVPVAGTTRSPPRNSKASKASNAKTILALVPLFDMINHGYARGTGIGSRHAADDAPAVTISFVESRGAVVVSAGVPFRGPGEEIRFNYGEKPSQYAFLQYGFVPRFNPDECVEVAPRMSKKDPLRRRKREVLASHDLSPNNRNFHFYPNRLDRDLLAATRVQVMTEAELDDPLAVASAVAGGVVSERNEAVTRATLLKAAHELLLRYPTTLAEDLATMDKFLDENPYDPVFGAEKRRTGDAPATPREDKTRTRIRRDETSDAADSRYRAAVAMRVLEKRTLLSAARLLVQELDDALAEETCRERYARTREETRDCLARASGEAFDAFDARESAEEENGGGVRSEDGPGNERREASAGSARGGEL
jgi:histone-lysine N-methyltransferase SETD3